MNISNIPGIKGMLGDLLTKAPESQGNEALVTNDSLTMPSSSVQEDTVEFSPSSLARSRNMMSQNFIGGYIRDTKYIDAQRAGAASVQNMQNALSASLMSSMSANGPSLMSGETSIQEDLAEAIFYNSDPKLPNAKLLKDTTDSHRELFAEQKTELTTKAEEALADKAEETADSAKQKDLVEQIEEKAEEAMAPKDENGEPIEQDTKNEHAPDTQDLAKEAAKDAAEDLAKNDIPDAYTAMKEKEKIAEERKALKIKTS